MKNLYIAFVCVCCLAQTSIAQDYAVALKTPAVYTQYYINPFLVNPAFTGFDQTTKLIFNFRDHWSRFPGSPKGITLAINGSATPKVGVGAYIYNENYGDANRFVGRMDYAYNFQSGTNKFGIGIGGEYIRYSLDNDVITDPNHNGGDPVINAAVNGEQFFGANLGFVGEFNDMYRFSIALPHVISARLDNKKTDEDKQLAFLSMFGITWRIPEYRMSIEPSISVRKIGDVPFMAGINAKINLLDDKLFGGFSYENGPGHRTGYLIGARIRQLQFFYSYDYSYQDFQTYNNGSHELTLSFDLHNRNNNKKSEMMEN